MGRLDGCMGSVSTQQVRFSWKSTNQSKDWLGGWTCKIWRVYQSENQRQSTPHSKKGHLIRKGKLGTILLEYA